MKSLKARNNAMKKQKQRPSSLLLKKPEAMPFILTCVKPSFQKKIIKSRVKHGGCSVMQENNQPVCNCYEAE